MVAELNSAYAMHERERLLLRVPCAVCWCCAHCFYSRNDSYSVVLQSRR